MQSQLRGSTQIKDSTIPNTKIEPAVFSSAGSIFTDKEDLAAQIQTPPGNLVFTLANAPFPGSEHVFWRGTLRKGSPATGFEYTLAGSTITFLVAPETGDDLVVSYRKLYA
jgi:hypothetical protein